MMNVNKTLSTLLLIMTVHLAKAEGITALEARGHCSTDNGSEEQALDVIKHPTMEDTYDIVLDLKNIWGKVTADNDDFNHTVSAEDIVNVGRVCIMGWKVKFPENYKAKKFVVIAKGDYLLGETGKVEFNINYADNSNDGSVRLDRQLVYSTDSGVEPYTTNTFKAKFSYVKDAIPRASLECGGGNIGNFFPKLRISKHEADTSETQAEVNFIKLRIKLESCL